MRTMPRPSSGCLEECPGLGERHQVHGRHGERHGDDGNEQKHGDATGETQRPAGGFASNLGAAAFADVDPNRARLKTSPRSLAISGESVSSTPNAPGFDPVVICCTPIGLTLPLEVRTRAAVSITFFVIRIWFWLGSERG